MIESWLLELSVTTDWFESAGTFRRCTAEKASFVAPCVFDLALTMLSIYLGFAELNPFVRFLVQIPVLLLVVKLFIPLLIAWFMPGKHGVTGCPLISYRRPCLSSRRAAGRAS